jgi:hypothetical protein
MNLSLSESPFHFPESLRDICPSLFNRYSDNRRKEKEARAIVDALRELNVICVSLQYRSHYAGRLDAEINEQMEIVKHYKGYNNLSKVELFKALQCTQYQIEISHLQELRELTQPEQNGLLFLKEMINSLAFSIVDEMPAYNTAPWGID